MYEISFMVYFPDLCFSVKKSSSNNQNFCDFDSMYISCISESSFMNLVIRPW